MKCKDIMTKNIITCFKNTSIRDVSKIMKDKCIGMIPVVYEDTGFVAGLITDRDIVTRVIAYDKSFDDKVCNFMTVEFVSVFENDDISIGISKMADYQIKRIIVTNNYKQITGIISLKDIALNKDTNIYLNDLLNEICIPNPQVNKPQAYLRCDDFPL